MPFFRTPKKLKKSTFSGPPKNWKNRLFPDPPEKPEKPQNYRFFEFPRPPPRFYKKCQKTKGKFWGFLTFFGFWGFPKLGFRGGPGGVPIRPGGEIRKIGNNQRDSSPDGCGNNNPLEIFFTLRFLPSGTDGIKIWGIKKSCFQGPGSIIPERCRRSRHP